MPPQPPGVWKSTYSGEKWKNATGPDRYRRGLYTYLKRTSPHPAMITFDAGSGEVCQIRRIRTNTPLQALTMLNNRIFVEGARKMAERMLQEVEGPLEAKIRYGFQLVLTRQPTAEELDILLQLYKETRQQFVAAPKSATSLLSVGESKRAVQLKPVNLAAMAVVASTILNLDEAVTKP